MTSIDIEWWWKILKFIFLWEWWWYWWYEWIIVSNSWNYNRLIWKRNTSWQAGVLFILSVLCRQLVWKNITIKHATGVYLHVCLFVYDVNSTKQVLSSQCLSQMYVKHSTLTRKYVSIVCYPTARSVNSACREMIHNCNKYDSDELYHDVVCVWYPFSPHDISGKDWLVGYSHVQ